MTTIRYCYEYRINKKGAECFRTTIRKEAEEKLAELEARRPGIYSMQSRSVQVLKNGIKHQDGLGRPTWGPWQ